LSRLVPVLLLCAAAAFAQNDPAARGAQLVKEKNCALCHTPKPDLPLAGGKVFKWEGKEVAPANLTPDASGISYYNEDMFVKALRTGTVGARKLSTMMNPALVKNLSDDDLKAMFAYLKTIKPISHRVDNAEPAALCKVCGFKHGAGGQNQQAAAAAQ
jgi:mono/diheme cytochrome c family protein